MHSRIAGTGGYLPAQILTNADLAQRIDTERRMGANAHRHLPAPHRRAGRADQRSGAGRGAAGAGGGGHRAGRCRSDHRRDDDARHDLSVDGVHPAGQARRERTARHSTCRRSAAVSSTRSSIADRMVTSGGGAQCAGRRRRNLFAHSRLERSRHLRAVRRRRRRGRARAVANAPGILSAHLHADGSYRDILSVPGTVANGAVSGRPFLQMDGTRRVQVRGEGARRGRAGSAGVDRHGRRARSIG